MWWESKNYVIFLDFLVDVTLWKFWEISRYNKFHQNKINTNSVLKVVLMWKEFYILSVIKLNVPDLCIKNFEYY